MRQVPTSSPLHRHRRAHRDASNVPCSSSSSHLRRSGKEQLDAIANKKNAMRVKRRQSSSASEETPHTDRHSQRQHSHQSKSKQRHQTKSKGNSRRLRRLLKHKKSHDSPEETSCCETLQSSASSLQQLQSKKSVSFGQVHIREHARLVVDHPSCPDGLGLGLDWMHGDRAISMDVNLFEQCHKRGGKGKARRMQSFERKFVLKTQGGFKEDELMNAYFNHELRSTPSEYASQPGRRASSPAVSAFIKEKIKEERDRRKKEGI